MMPTFIAQKLYSLVLEYASKKLIVPVHEPQSARENALKCKIKWRENCRALLLGSAQIMD